MSRPQISLIVVSRDRPHDLATHLSCLRFQTIARFETIVVSNLPLPDGPHPDPIRHLDCPDANISVARNLGLAVAQGEIVVFCDDDCLPEPDFLHRITRPFVHAEVGASGGYTRGANGVTMQWQATGFDRSGVDHPLTARHDQPYTVFPPKDATFVKTVGTACAFRTDALRSIGGFDPLYRYYFDETDVNLRLSQAGWHTAIVPGAQVHHAFAAGPYRDRRRVPRDLYEIGFSCARFCRLHSPVQGSEAHQALRHQIRQRVFQGYNLGLIDPSHFRFLLRRLDEGLDVGLHNDTPSPNTQVLARPPDIIPTVAVPRLHFLLVGRRVDVDPLARGLAARGYIITVLDARRSVYPMWTYFSDGGYWLHQGGIWGQIRRRGTALKLRRKSSYIVEEIARLARFRPVNYLITPGNSNRPAPISPELTNIPELYGMTVVKLPGI